MNKTEFRNALEELGLSQAGLARALSEAHGSKVPPQTIYMYASGRRKVPAGLAAYLAELLAKHRRRKK